MSLTELDDCLCQCFNILKSDLSDTNYRARMLYLASSNGMLQYIVDFTRNTPEEEMNNVLARLNDYLSLRNDHFHPEYICDGFRTRADECADNY